MGKLMAGERFDIIEWDGTTHSVTAEFAFESEQDRDFLGNTVFDRKVAVRYCDGVVHEVTWDYFTRVMKAKAVLHTDPFHHVEGCKCKK